MDGLKLLRKLKAERRQQQQGNATTTAAAAAPTATAPPPEEEPAAAQQQPRQPEGPRRDFWENEDLLLRTFQVNDKTIKLLEDPLGKFAAGNGATLWDCSLALARFLEWRFCCSGSSSWEGRRVLELGAGLGLVSMTLASLGAKVTATEREICVPLLTRNLEENGLLRTSEEDGACCVASFDWSWGALPSTTPSTASPSSSTPSSFDIVVGADLAFPSNSENYDYLADVFHHALSDGAEEAWLAHEQRRPEVESLFWDGLQKRGIVALRMVPAEGGDSSDASCSDSGQPPAYPTTLPPANILECQCTDIGIYRLCLLPTTTAAKTNDPPADPPDMDMDMAAGLTEY